MRRRDTHRRGMTLAEVLATIAIMAIVLPVLMQGISIATGLASVTRQRAQALSLAETKLNELIVSGEWQTASLSGDFSPDWPEYKWQVVVGDWDEVDMRLMRIKVEWLSRGTPREVVLSTLIYENPEASTL